MLTSRHALAVAFAQPDVGFPADVLDHCGWFVASQLQMSAALGGRAVGPGAFHEHPSGRGVASLGARALWASLTGRICRRDPPQEFPACSWGIKPGQIAHGSDQGDGHGAWHAPERLQGFDHRVPPPGWPVLVACLVEPREACGVCGHRTDLFLEHDWRRWGRTDDCREPPEMGRAPMGPAGGAAIVSAQEGCAAHLGVLAIAEGICTGSGASAHRFLVHCGALHDGESPRARQPRQAHGVSAVGCDAVSSLVGPKCRGHDPAVVAFCRPIAGEPGAARPRVRDEEEVCGLRWPLADALIASTLTGPNSTEGGHLSARLWGDIRHGHCLFVDIPSDQECARLRHG